MAPGNPPRHSKSTDEPVTIDLDAQEIASANNAEDIPPPPQTEPNETDVPADAPKEETEAPRDAVAEEQPAQPVHRREGGNTSGLIAAGIVGGLIALVGAGAIQYAGFLPGPSATKVPSADIANLTSEIDGLKQSLASLATSPQPAPDGTLETRLAALEEAAKTAPSQAGADNTAVAALNQKLADLTGQIDQLRGAVAQASEQKTSDSAGIEQRLAEAEKKLNEPRQDVAVARAIGAAALKAAIDRGGPFVAELDTFASVSPDDPVTADLRNFAQTGVPSRAELIDQVPDVATAIVDSVNQTDPSQSWSDRLMSSAKSLVKVRPVGNIEGESVEAIAARMEDKVKNGDLPGAAAEWNDLPAQAKQASAAFKQSLEARIRVEDLVGSALSKAVSGAGKEG
ncbi:mitofilin family membrane protein [Rhizobium sp. S96]|uniref:COG4223 family protein n=1 Tax=Rhizobium sp. S96 TaxID=3055140 RepID=UPI0025AB5D08|nr:mitofilin family membrane protein [Rhizobium sp. S96]MDM9621417.1 mitofilin family membrane protein [Rhizobium sp. S96]